LENNPKDPLLEVRMRRGFGIVLAVVAILIAMVAFFVVLMSLPEKRAANEEVVQPIITGNVYYFPAVDSLYHRSLNAFHDARPELKCDYIGPTYSSARGVITGHAFLCTDASEEAQQTTAP
jgi:hypothetical protein